MAHLENLQEAPMEPYKAQQIVYKQAAPPELVNNLILIFYSGGVSCL